MERNHHYLFLSNTDGIKNQQNVNDFTIELPSELQLKENWYCGLAELNLKIKSETSIIYVCCDICQDSFVKNRQLPLWRKIHVTKKQYNVSYNPIHYVKLSRESVRHIRIYIKDQDLKPTSFANGTLTCTLHLIKQW